MAVLIVGDVRWQLRNVLDHCGRQIVDAHRSIHEKNAAFSSQDSRRFQGYQKKMESKAEFDNKRINLIVSASSGAVFRRLTSSAYSYPHKDWNTLRTK
ncbi:unnamed protein product [Caenorhabditis sp. 36 PRJEB53466]|nr:unnamed protein product [Caenorhabditis sp. 36 PRJEB53466]